MDELNKVFSCRRCGFCCHGETTVSLDAEDQERMIAEIGLPREEVTKKYWRVTGGVVQMKTVDGHCIFYKDGCSIHKGRPWRCAQWPFVPAILDGYDNFKIIRDSCPGINRDIPYNDFCRIVKDVFKTLEKVKC